MRKLKLDLENLEVESFETGAHQMGTMTVRAYQDFNMDPFGGDAGLQGEAAGGASDYASCPTAGCGTCYYTCWNTCNASCPGTSGVEAAQFEG